MNLIGNWSQVYTQEGGNYENLGKSVAINNDLAAASTTDEKVYLYRYNETIDEWIHTDTIDNNKENIGIGMAIFNL